MTWRIYQASNCVFFLYIYPILLLIVVYRYMQKSGEGTKKSFFFGFQFHSYRYLILNFWPYDLILMTQNIKKTEEKKQRCVWCSQFQNKTRNDLRNLKKTCFEISFCLFITELCRGCSTCCREGAFALHTL